MTQRHRLSNAKEHLGRVDALLSAWIDDWKREGEEDPTHDRIVLARQSIRDALGWLEGAPGKEAGNAPPEEPLMMACVWPSPEFMTR